MEVGKLTVQVRTGSGKGVARKLRAQALVPGVCYGHNVDVPLTISLSPKELQRSLDPLKRQNTVIDMTVQDNGATAHQLTVMLKDYQVHPTKRHVMHVDLVAIDASAEVEVEVPIKLVGKHKGLVAGGQLHVVSHELRVWCKPANIPSHLDLDISELDIGDVLHVSDLVLPEGVEALDSARLTIITCTAPAAEEEKKDAAEGEAAADGAAATAAAGDKKAGDKKAGDKKEGAAEAKK